MKDYKQKVYEVHSVMNDIVYDAERGKCTWEEALDQMYAERTSIELFKEEDEEPEDDC